MEIVNNTRNSNTIMEISWSILLYNVRPRAFILHEIFAVVWVFTIDTLHISVFIHGDGDGNGICSSLLLLLYSCII